MLRVSNEIGGQPDRQFFSDPPQSITAFVALIPEADPRACESPNNTAGHGWQKHERKNHVGLGAPERHSESCEALELREPTA
jgi:hypothetical protein